jgi:hypothetical protein
MQRSLKHPQGKALASPPPYTGPRAAAVRIGRCNLIVELTDGRTLVVPLSLIPGFDALPRSALSTHELIGDGIGIHFPAIDDDLSVENLLHPERAMWPATPPRLVPQASARRRFRRVAGR